MQKIASFTVNHNVLEKGMYISRIDGDVVTYDIRMKKPNGGNFLGNGELHTLEHLLATYLRNSNYSDSVVYVGPMGCRTGFYVLLRDAVSHKEAISLVRDSLKYIAQFDGVISGSKKEECGNYLEHDLNGARSTALDMFRVLEHTEEKDLIYKE
ncbi:MAG: S-ribosylhomocysteine lyase [Clostridia bacterium]|nr:S-ribosylhomocysteine lyase [Clostridia bacterium]